MKSIDARSLPPEAQEALRTKAVKAGLDGRTRIEVADLIGVTRQTVSLWVKAYEAEGEKALGAEQRGRPERSGSRVLPRQKALVARTLRDRMPDQLKPPFYLWTRESVMAWVEERFEVRVPVWTAGRYLKRWGFSPQKPKRRAYERSEAAMKALGGDVVAARELGLSGVHGVLLDSLLFIGMPPQRYLQTHINLAMKKSAR
jgi:transposase